MLSHETTHNGNYDSNGLLRHYLRLCVLTLTADKLFYRSAASQSMLKTKSDCHRSENVCFGLLKYLVEFPFFASHFTSSELAKDKMTKRALNKVPLVVLCQYTQLLNKILLDTLPIAPKQTPANHSLDGYTKLQGQHISELKNVYEKFALLSTRLECLTAHAQTKMHDTDGTNYKNSVPHRHTPINVFDTMMQTGKDAGTGARADAAYNETTYANANSIQAGNGIGVKTLEDFNCTKSSVLTEFFEALMRIRQIVSGDACVGS